MSSISSSIKTKLLGALAAVTFISTVTAAANTVAHYRFEDGSAGTAATQATDSSPTGDHMNVITDGDNSPVFSSDVPVSTIPGTGDANNLSIDIADAAVGFQGTDAQGLSNVVFDDITIELWINFSDTGGWQTFVGRDDLQNQTGGDTPFLQFQNTEGGQFRIFWYDRAEVGHDLVAFTPSANTWYHVAVVGDSSAGTMSLYVDGAQVATRGDFTGLHIPDPVSSWTIGRGQWGGNPVDWVNAQIDEVRFSDAALTPAQFLNFEGERIEITQQPVDVYVWDGEDATFSVAASLVGDSELTYQWQVSEDGGETWNDITGATDASHTIAGAGLALDRNLYRVILSSAEATEESNAVVLRVGDAAAPPQPAGVVAHYRFEEGAAGSDVTGAVDSSGNGFDLGVLTTDTASPVYSDNVPTNLIPQNRDPNNLSIDFSTGDVALEGVDGEGLSNVEFDDFTIEAYVSFNDVGGWQTFIGRDDRGNQNDDGHAIFYLQNRDNNVFGVSWVDRNGTVHAPGLQGVSIQPNTWYHVAVIADLGAETIALYVDGVEVDRNNNFVGLFIPTDPVTQWNIGRGQWAENPGDWVNGQIDEVRFSNVALAPTELLHFNTSVLRYAIQPEDVTVPVGAEVNFSALAGGGGVDPLTYQWEVSEDGGQTWSPISGATEPTYTIPSVGFELDGNHYRVIASRGGESEASNAALLSVPDFPDPNVVQDLPDSLILFVGDSQDLEVEATGLGNITYQWLKDGAELAGETGNVLSLDSLTLDDSGTYSVVVSDDAAEAAGDDAKTVTLSTVVSVLSHSQGAISLNFVGAATDGTWNLDVGPIDPADAAGVVPVGNWNNSADAHGVASQTTPLPLVDDVGEATSATATWASGNTWASRITGGLLIDKDADQRIYHGYIESRDGSTVTVDDIPYSTYDVYVYPMGVEGPSGEYIRSVTLEDAAGSETTYFGRNYSGDPGSHPIPFILASATSLEEAEASGPASVYRFAGLSGSSVTITHQDEVGWNLGGIAGVSIVNTTPGAPVRPLLTSRPSGQFVPAGEDVQLSVTAQAMNDGSSLSYQWQKDGVNVAGATDSTLVLSNVDSGDTGRYSVVVTDNSNQGTITNEASAAVVVVDDNRRALLSLDVNSGTHPWMEGHGRLRTTGLVPFEAPNGEDNPMEIGVGDSIWNRFWGRGGTFSYSDFVDSEGLPLTGVTFTVADANGGGDAPSGGGIEPLGDEQPETYSAPLLRDYVFADNGNTMALTLGGLQAFAGRELTLVVYALGPLSTFDISHESDDIATVALAEANNHLGQDPVATETSEEGREVRWNEDAVAVFDARVAANGTVTWTVGPVPDREGINAMNGFQVLFSDEGEPIDPPPSGIADWREEFFGSPDNTGAGANDADFDGDGLLNLMEYALGSDPTVAGDGADAVAIGQDGNFLTLTFNHIDDPAVTYLVESTEDLNSGVWTEEATYTFNAAGTETFTDSVPVGDDSRRFLRLRVEIAE